MPGRSGADLSNLINEAALLAARRDENTVGAAEISEARDRILRGPLRAGIVLEGRERRAVAIHESGPGLVAHLTPAADPVAKVSITPRGRGLGMTRLLPEERTNCTEEDLRARLAVMLAGRAAGSTRISRPSSTTPSVSRRRPSPSTRTCCIDLPTSSNGRKLSKGSG